MEIIIGKFKLTPNDVSPQNFDLIEIVTRNKTEEVDGKKTPTGETYEADGNPKYSMPLEHCLKIIIGSKLADIDLKVSLKEYLEYYVKEKRELKELVENVLKVL